MEINHNKLKGTWRNQTSEYCFSFDLGPKQDKNIVLIQIHRTARARLGYFSIDKEGISIDKHHYDIKEFTGTRLVLEMENGENETLIKIDTHGNPIAA